MKAYTAGNVKKEVSGVLKPMLCALLRALTVPLFAEVYYRLS